VEIGAVLVTRLRNATKDKGGGASEVFPRRGKTNVEEGSLGNSDGRIHEKTEIARRWLLAFTPIDY